MRIERIYTPDEVDATRDAVTLALLEAGHRQRGEHIVLSCPSPAHDDKTPSASWNVVRGAWRCYSRGCEKRHGGGGALAFARLLGIAAGGALTPAMEMQIAESRRKADGERVRAQAETVAALRRLARRQVDRECADRLWSCPDALADLGRRGISRECAAVHLIGYDPESPVAGRWRALVWPWMLGFDLVSLQLRNLDEGGKGGRYRWHGALGQNGARLYRYDAGIERRRGEPLVVVEGFLKAMTLWSAGLRGVAALVSSGSLDSETAALLSDDPSGVVIAPDPDAYDAMAERARSMPGARIVRLPAKPDDLLLDQGVTVLRRFIDRARAA